MLLNIAVKDARLRCVKELVYAEEVYNECLKSLFDLYAEPLRLELLTCPGAYSKCLLAGI